MTDFMADCYAPRLALQHNEGEKPHFVHNIDLEFWSKINDKSLGYRLLLLPCGKCPACLQNKALEWTARLMKEAEEWKYTYFITLTYDDVNLTDLNKRDIQLFLKRFRKATGFELKYYVSGEYGETTGRPHYHAVFFLNEKIDDLKPYSNNYFTSELFTKTWQHGQVIVSSDVNERSIKYTIGYTLKKLGESKITLMSKGLGLKYLIDKKENIKFSKGFYLNNGFLVEPPFYFLRKMKESEDESDLAWLDEYKNQPRSSQKIDVSLLDRAKELYAQKSKQKGKGVF